MTHHVAEPNIEDSRMQHTALYPKNMRCSQSCCKCPAALCCSNNSMMDFSKRCSKNCLTAHQALYIRVQKLLPRTPSTHACTHLHPAQAAIGTG